MKNLNSFIILSLLFILAISCSDDQCNAETESLLRTEILVKSAGLKKIKYLDSLSIYSPEWIDSIQYLVEGVTKEKSLYFMLSPTNDTTEIIFASREDTVLNDTIFIFSQREYLFLSPDCGFVTNFNIDTVLFTENNIDSLEVIISEMSTVKNGHVQIYF